MINKFQSIHSRLIIAIIAIFYLIGILLSVFFGIENIAKLTPLVLLVMTAAVFLYSVPIWTKQTVIILISVGALGFLFEVIGVNTGFLFGDYRYGNILGPTLFNVPVLLLIMWPLVTWLGLCVYKLLANVSSRVRLLIAACIVVIYDVFLEPFAVSTGMWQWANDVVPLKNYLTWLLLSILFITLLVKKDIQSRKEGFVVVAMGVQAIYFFVISVLATVQ